jgi:hypothetical protein
MNSEQTPAHPVEAHPLQSALPSPREKLSDQTPMPSVSGGRRNPRCRSAFESFRFGVGGRISGFFCDRVGLRRRSEAQSALQSGSFAPRFHARFRGFRFLRRTPRLPWGFVPRKSAAQRKSVSVSQVRSPLWQWERLPAIREQGISAAFKFKTA